jgi:DNA mismatch endonuclease (patch repair protein)
MKGWHLRYHLVLHVHEHEVDPIRSRIMRAVPQRHSKPEVIVRSVLHRMGYRFRLHRRDLPGTPDIVLSRHRAVVFVHGCFWHRHGCGKTTTPKTRREFWENKFATNVERDRKAIDALKADGWRVIVVWECECNDVQTLSNRLRSELEHQSST